MSSVQQKMIDCCQEDGSHSQEVRAVLLEAFGINVVRAHACPGMPVQFALQRLIDCQEQFEQECQWFDCAFMPSLVSVRLCAPSTQQTASPDHLLCL